MKESTGGALLMGLAAGIIIIFIIMVAFFISYGKTFRLKNDVINRIEQSEGMTKDQIRNFIYVDRHYNAEEPEYCINRIIGSSGDFRGFTINVTVYMSMDKNILGSAFKVDIPVSGETRIIEKGNTFNQLSTGYNITGLSYC